MCLIVVLIWARSIVGLFSHDPAMIDIATNFLRIATGAYLVMGVTSALSACINGAGDTLPTMLINIGMIWIVQLPVAYRPVQLHQPACVWNQNRVGGRPGSRCHCDFPVFQIRKVENQKGLVNFPRSILNIFVDKLPLT